MGQLEAGNWGLGKGTTTLGIAPVSDSWTIYIWGWDKMVVWEVRMTARMSESSRGLRYFRSVYILYYTHITYGLSLFHDAVICCDGRFGMDNDNFVQRGELIRQSPPDMSTTDGWHVNCTAVAV